MKCVQLRITGKVQGVWYRRWTVGQAKALARALGPTINDEVIDDTIRRLADIWEGEEACEGISAFLEKRDPRW